MLYFIMVRVLRKVITKVYVEKECLINELRLMIRKLKKKQWPRGAKDLYIFFLQKVGNK